VNTAEVSAARENERKRRMAAAGRSSTLLTGGTGITEDAPAQKKTLGA
tara:strand:+ start:3303 stop:3446 length:144 start_codon:yes stop_codon:yes gene_type:complete